MRRAVVWLFHALLISVPFAFTAVNEELFEFNKMLLVYGFTTLIISAWASRMVLEKRLIWRRTPLLPFIMLYLSGQVLATIFSIHPSTSIFGYYSRFHGGLLSTLAYISLYLAAVSNFSRRDIEPLIRSSVLAGIGVALYAFPEHFGVSPSCVLITNEFSVSCWVQDVQTRVFGTFGQPNWLAAYLLVLMPLSVWLWKKSQNQLVRWLSGAAFPLFFTVLLFTGSRSGFLGFTAGSATALAFVLYRVGVSRMKSTKILIPPATRRLCLLIVLSIMLPSLLFGTPYSPSLSQLLSRLTPSEPAPATADIAEIPTSGTVLDSGGSSSGEIRRIVWLGALAVWQRYPLFGSGTETFAYSYYQDRLPDHNHVSEWDFLYNKAHNEFLNVLATTGLVGLTTLVLLMLAFCWHLWRRGSSLSLAILSGYIALAVSNALGFSTVMVGALFMIVKAWHALEDTPDPAPVASKITPTKRRISSEEIDVEFDSRNIFTAIIWLIAAFVLLSIWRTWQNDRLLAAAKRQVALRQPTTAYQMFRELTQRAPGEALYWDEQALFLANVAAAAGPTDATLAAQLANEALESSDKTISLNPVHVSFWKTRAKVFIYLAGLDPTYYEFALETLDRALQLAPTDPKNYLNRALVLKEVGRFDEARDAFEQAIELKPDYELARNEFGKFLESVGDLAAAAEQYRYVSTQLKPGEEFSTQRLREIEASLSAETL